MEMNQQSAEDVLVGATEEQQPTAAELLSQEGNLLFEMERYGESLEKYTQVIAEKGDKATEIDYSNRANAFTEVGKLDEAIQDCQQAIKINPKYIKAYYRHSKVMAYKNKLSAALEILKQAQAKEKENVEIREKIAKLEQEMAFDKKVAKDHPKRLELNRYLDWLKGQGSQFHNVKVSMFNLTEKCVIATQDIHKAEPLLFIPDKLITKVEDTFQNVTNSWLQWNPKVQDKIIKKEVNAMAVWYLEEKKKENSKCKKYFDSLNPNIEECVSMWGQEEFDVVKGAYLAQPIAQINAVIEADYNTIVNNVEEFKNANYTLQQYREAWTTMELHIQNMTREKKETCGLVPFINYFTQSDDSQTFLTYDEENKGFIVVARKHIPRGEFVNIPAPSPNNDYFILKKGYIHPLRETTIPIRVALSPQDPLYREKCSLIGNQGMDRTFMVSGNFNTENFQNLIFFLRYYMFSGSKEQLILVKKNEIDRKIQGRVPFNNETAFDGTKVISYHGEMEECVWKHIGMDIQEKQTRYAISMKECADRIVAHENGTEPFKNQSQEQAYRYIFIEQENLQKIRNFVDMFLGLLTMEWEQFKEIATKDEGVMTTFKDYVASSIYPHQQDRQMRKEGVEPPRRFAEPGEEDSTYSKIQGDSIVYLHPDQQQANSQLQQQMAAQQAAAGPSEGNEVQQLPGQPEQDSSMGGML